MTALPTPTSRSGGAHDDFAASPAQSRLWTLQRFFPQMSVYNVSVLLRFDTVLDLDALQHAVDALVERHESLRTVLVSSGGGLLQRVHRTRSDASRVPVQLRVLEHGAEAVPAAQAICVEPFDLEHGPLVRVQVLRDAASDLLVLVLHHAITDGWSGPIVVGELAAFYAEASTGEPVKLDDLPVQAADVAQWELARLSPERRRELVAFWRRQLDGMPRLDLTFDRPRPAVPGHAVTRHDASIPNEVAHGLRALCRERRVTTYMALLAATAVVLGRWARQEDVPMLAQVAQRPLPSAQSVVGLFINGIVVRVGLDGDPSFVELLDRVCDEFLDALENAELPFDEVVVALNPQRGLKRNPLTQVSVGLEKADGPVDFAGLLGVPVDMLLGTSADLDIMFEEDDAGGLTLTVLADADLFDPRTGNSLTSSLVTALHGLVAHPERPVSSASCLDATARVALSNSEQSGDYPYESVQALFEEQVSRTPHAVAVHYGEGAVTYAELNARVNRVTRALRGRGVVLESPVGLCMQRSVERVVAMLAILKAGGFYVPLPHDDPTQRLRRLVDDSGADLVLTDAVTHPDLAWYSGALAWADLAASAPADASNPEPVADGDTLAHCIYTSGSTGTPNAVGVAQHSLARLVRNARYHEFTPGDVFLQLSPLTFDASLVELWGPLLNGGAVVVVPDAGGPPEFLEQVRTGVQEHPVTMVQLISPQLGLVVEHAPELLGGVDTVLVGGDVLAPQTAARARALMRNDATLLHMYGPTESTLFATYDEITDPDPATRLPIGLPIGNTSSYVVDPAGNLVPPGAPGELWLGGAGLARGYLGRSTLTAQRFVPDRFSGRAGARLYRTGDLVRALPDGRLDFLGRIDHQVKVRGRRIETGEVASALRTHPQVADAVVVVRADLPGGPDLVAYVVPDPAGGPDVAELQAHLGDRLPSYLLPAAIVLLPSLPLTRHGKVDAAALPAVAGPVAPLEPPRPGTERSVAALWQRLLGVEALDRMKTFFDSGGNSLLMIQLAEHLGDQFPDAGLSIGDLFDHPTIAKMAFVIDDRAHLRSPAR